MTMKFITTIKAIFKTGILIAVLTSLCPITDVMAQVKGDEKKVEAFFAEITEMAVNQFNLNPPSTDLLLLDDDKDS